MFHRAAGTTGTKIAFTIDGRPAEAWAGDSVAAALLAAGQIHCRTTPVSGARRAPYCMMGVCFECLVAIDGVGNRQGCMVLVAEGMAVATQVGPRQIVECPIVESRVVESGAQVRDGGR